MSENIFAAIVEIFTGKGGGLKLAIVCITALGIASMITDNDYEVNAATAKGGRLSMKPNHSNENDAPEEACDPDPVAAEEPE